MDLHQRRNAPLVGLDPSDRLCEITSGIAVVLTLLVGTSFYSDDVSDPRSVLVGVAIVAALASGLAGGVLNVVEDLYEDAELRQARRTIRRAEADKRRRVMRQRIQDEFGIDVPDDVADRLIGLSAFQGWIVGRSAQSGLPA